MRTELAGAAMVLALVAGVPAPARALNEDVMRNILSPVYLAQNLTAVCMRIDPEFARKLGGKGGDASALIRHIQDEILATMTREEAAPIVLSAAGAARAVGLGMIRSLAGGSIEEQTARATSLVRPSPRPCILLSRGSRFDHVAGVTLGSPKSLPSPAQSLGATSSKMT